MEYAGLGLAWENHRWSGPLPNPPPIELGIPCETVNESTRRFFSVSALCNDGNSFASNYCVIAGNVRAQFDATQRIGLHFNSNFRLASMIGQVRGADGCLTFTAGSG
jgi:hypothetical protein